ncbi:MAG: HlyD family secretion protein [Pirellulales bacterium]
MATSSPQDRLGGSLALPRNLAHAGGGVVSMLPAAAILALVLIGASGCREPAEQGFGGYIEAEKIEVGSRVGGRVAEVFVEEGDEVAAGKLLVRFEDVQLKAELAEAQHAVDRYAAVFEKLLAGPRVQEIEKARQDLSAAVARMNNARAEYKRGMAMGPQVIPKERLESLQTTMLAAEALERGLRAALSLLEEGTRAEDVLAAWDDLEVARDRVARAADQLRESEVKAPLAAVVETFDLRPGDLVAPGAPLATLVRKDELWVRAFVPTTRITFLHPGQIVNVTVDSRPGEVFAGKILRINRVAEYTPRNVQTYEQREDQVFGVKVRIKDPAGVLRPGMAATMWLPKPSPDAVAEEDKGK